MAFEGSGPAGRGAAQQTTHGTAQQANQTESERQIDAQFVGTPVWLHYMACGQPFPAALEVQQSMKHGISRMSPL